MVVHYGAMRRVIFAAFLGLTSLLLAGRPARATEVGNARSFGLGVAVGAPTSIVGKLFLSSSDALDFGLGFYTWGHRYGDDCWDEKGRHYDCDYRFDHFTINVDYLWQDNLARGTAKLDWHIGAGGRLWLFSGDRYHDHAALAARMPIGLDLTFDRPSFLEVFLELAPALYILPGLDLDIEALIGVRFYF